MKKIVAIIIGGTGQFGITITKKLLKKNYKVIITTRSKKKFNSLLPKIKLKHLNIYNKSKYYVFTGVFFYSFLIKKIDKISLLMV